MELHAHIQPGPLTQKWDDHRLASGLLSPANRCKFKIIVVGTGLAGAAATLAGQEYQVTALCIQDSHQREMLKLVVIDGCAPKI